MSALSSSPHKGHTPASSSHTEDSESVRPIAATTHSASKFVVPLHKEDLEVEKGNEEECASTTESQGPPATSLLDPALHPKTKTVNDTSAEPSTEESGGHHHHHADLWREGGEGSRTLRRATHDVVEDEACQGAEASGHGTGVGLPGSPSPLGTSFTGLDSGHGTPLRSAPSSECHCQSDDSISPRFRVQDSDAGDAEVFRGIPSRQHREIPHPPPPEGLQAAKITRTATALPDSGSVSLSENAGGKSRTFTEVPRSSPHIPGAAAPSAVAAPSIWDSNNGKHLGMSATMTPFHLLSSNAANTALQRVSSIFVTGVSASTHGSERVSAIQTPTSTTPLRATPTAMTTAPASGAYAVASGSSALPSPARTTTAPKRVETEPGAVGSSTSRNSSPTTANPHPSLPRHSRTSSGKCSVSSPSGASPRSTAALPAYQQYYCLACHTAGLSLLDFLTGAHVQHQGLSVEEALLFTPSVLLHELQQGIERYYEQRAAPSGGTTRGRSTSAAGGVSPSGRSSSRPQRQLSGGRHYHPNEEFWREAPAARENAGGDEALLFGVSKAEREIMKQRAKEELRELLQWQSKIQRRMEEQRCLLHLLRCEDKRQEAAQQRWKERRREAFKAQLRRLQRAAEGLQKLMEDRLEMTRQQQQHQKQQQDSRSRSLKCHVSEDPSSLPGRASTGEHHQCPTSSDAKNAAGRPLTPTPNAPRSPNFTTSPDHSSFHAHIRQHWNSQEELERVQKQVQEELEALEAQEEEEQLAAAEATGGDADESGKEEEEEEEEERFNAARKAIYQHRDSTSSSQLDPPPSSRHALRQKPAKEPPLPHPQRKCRATTAQGWKPEWLDAPQSPPQKSKLQQGTASSGAPNALRSLHVTHLHHHLEKGRFAMKKGTTAEPHSLSSEDSTAAVSSSKEKNSHAVASEVASVKSATSSRGSTSFRSDQEDDDEEDVRSLFDEEKDGTEGVSRAARLFSAAPRPHGSAPSRSQRVPPRPPLLSHPRSPTSFTSPRAVLPHTTVAPQPSPPTKRSNVRAERRARDHHDEPEGVAASKKTASGTRRGAGPISPSSDTTAHPALPCGDCSSRERRRRGLRQQAEEDARQLEEELQRLCDEAEAAQRGLDDGPLPDSSDPTTGLYVYRHHAEHLNPNNLILNSCHAEMRRKRAAAVAAAVAAASSRYPASTRTPLSPRRVSYSSGGGDASPTTTAARSTTTNTGGSQGHWRLPKQAGLLVAPSSAFSFTNSSQLSPSASQVSHNSSSTSSSRSSRPLSDNDNDRLGSSCSRSRSSGSSSSGNHTTESATWKAGSGTGEADPPQTKRENPHSHRDRGGLQKHLPAPHSAAQTDSNSNQPSKSHHHHRSAIAPQLDGISKVNSSRRRYHSSASGVATPIMTRTRAGRTQASGKGNAERGESILRTGTDLPPHSGGDEPAVAAMVSPRCRRRCHEKPPQEPHRRHAHKGAVLEPGGLSGGNVKDEEEMEGPDAVLSGLTLSQRAQYVAAAAGERRHRHDHQRPTAFSAQTSSHRTNASFSNDPVDKGNEELEAADEEDALVGEEESLARSGQRLRRKTTISLSSNLLPPSSASSSRPESHYQYGSRSDNLTASLPPTGAHPLSARKTKPQRHGTAGLPSSSTVAGSMHYPPPPAPVPVSSSVDRNIHTEPSDANDVAAAHNTTAAMKEEGVPHDENLRPLPPADLPHVTSPNAAQAGDSWQGVVATMGTSARSELET